MFEKPRDDTVCTKYEDSPSHMRLPLQQQEQDDLLARSVQLTLFSHPPRLSPPNCRRKRRRVGRGGEERNRKKDRPNEGQG